MSYSSTILGTANVAGYWRLDDASGTNAPDLVSTNNGTYTGGFTLAQTGPNPAQLPLAVLLNGSTGQCGTSLTPVTTNHDVSTESWFRCDLITQPEQEIIAYGDGTTSGFGIIISGNGATNGNIGILWHNISWSPSTTLVSNGAWHHALASITAAGSLALYLDGVLTSATGAVFNAPIAAHGMAFGTQAHTPSAGRNFKGAICSAAVYGRALSQAEATAHYNAGLTALARHNLTLLGIGG